ncbi:hypothetical protein Btru_075016 [Bulinus truncatus]|nr:hypothetical protein Btru_075016 [Bulinus truncatus]
MNVNDQPLSYIVIQRVYVILFAQLLVTFGFICLFIFDSHKKMGAKKPLVLYLCLCSISGPLHHTGLLPKCQEKIS